MTETQIRTAINRELRRQGLTRAELARRLGCPRQRVTNMLNGTGERRLGDHDVLAIAQALRPDLDVMRCILQSTGVV